jgi:hypothetical protein
LDLLDLLGVWDLFDSDGDDDYDGGDVVFVFNADDGDDNVADDVMIIAFGTIMMMLMLFGDADVDYDDVYDNVCVMVLMPMV